jgi:alcohol dehydrogenase-like protein
MKALAIRRYGAPMEMMEPSRPGAGPGELLVRVRATGVNPIDDKIRDGAVKVLLPFSFPLILGTDLAGDVEAIGPCVTEFKRGDAVYARLDNDRIGASPSIAAAARPRSARPAAPVDGMGLTPLHWRMVGSEVALEARSEDQAIARGGGARAHAQAERDGRAQAKIDAGEELMNLSRSR